MKSVEIRFLNHASLLVAIEGCKILFDPWLEGYCFGEGWGLEFDHPKALEEASQATHLWISHFHEDHFHIPTLKKLVELNPHLSVLANDSHNFSLVGPMKNLGFQNVTPFHERQAVNLNERLQVMRYPTTGIDNMLVVTTPDFNILNFNDCNIPDSACQKLSQKIGRVDIMMTNFNTAGKVLKFPYPMAADMKVELKTLFLDRIEKFNPEFVIPFASQHYYRAIESQAQNEWRLSIADVAGFDERVVPIEVGGRAQFVAGEKPLVFKADHAVLRHEMDLLTHNKSYSLDELEKEFASFRERIIRAFFGCAFLFPSFKLVLSDLNLCVEVSLKNGLREVADLSAAPVSAHSESVYHWFRKPYGSSQLIIGAHFGLESAHLSSLRRLVLAALLTEAKLGLRDLTLCLFSASGLRFLWNRREEILALLLSRKLVVASGRR